MSTRMTKQTLKALDRTDYVVMSIRTQKPTVTAELTRTFSDTLPDGTPMPDWDVLQDAHAGRLEHSGDEVRRADQRHRQKLALMRNYRQQRQAIVKGLLGKYRTLRNSVEGTYPADGLTVIGIEEQPIRRFVAVREQMPEILLRLRDPELHSQMPEPLAGHQPLDFEHFAGPIDAGIRELETSMETIRQMRKILDESLLARREALHENRRVYLHLARIQEGYYRLVGLDELADRIRTEVHRLSPRRSPSGTEAPSAEDSPAGDAPPAKTPPAETPATGPQAADTKATEA